MYPCCRLSPQDLLLNYGFFDAANENHQATLLFDSAAAAGSRRPHPSAAQLDGMEVSTAAPSISQPVYITPNFCSRRGWVGCSSCCEFKSCMPDADVVCFPVRWWWDLKDLMPLR